MESSDEQNTFTSHSASSSGVTVFEESAKDLSIQGSPNRELANSANSPDIGAAPKSIKESLIVAQDESISIEEPFCATTTNFSTISTGPQEIDQAKSPTTNVSLFNRQSFLPWSVHTRAVASSGTCNMAENALFGDPTLRPGEIVMRALFHNFTQQAEKKIELVMLETIDKSISKLLQRSIDPTFDQLLTALGSVAEHCLPSLLRALIAWHTRQLSGRYLKTFT